MVQNYIEELQKAQNEKGENNLKVQRIMGKFKFGKKLTRQEIAYIRRHAPGLVDQVTRLTREREIMERSIKIAPTKHHVHMVYFYTSSAIEKQPSGEERIILSNQLADVKKQYEKTKEYKDKPASPFFSTDNTIKKANKENK